MAHALPGPEDKAFPPSHSWIATPGAPGVRRIDWAAATVAAGLAGTLALLLVHAGVYAFLTDDAHISFRYARNLADGHGLVFNPGRERVEGYTNFLWVLVLAGCARLRLPLEIAANVLSIVATVATWVAIVGFAQQSVRGEGRRAWVLVPSLLLACTRSFAVWSTSGLETRLFEFLIVTAGLRLVIEHGRLGACPSNGLDPGHYSDRLLVRGGSGIAPLAALLFALGTLTRPDGLVIACCAFGLAGLFAGRRLLKYRRWTLYSLAVYGILVGGHYLFRYEYYGAWLPNPYFAKVDGRTWWKMGLIYLESFGIEYAGFLWVPFLIAGVLYHRRRRNLFLPALFGAVIVPHALYVAAIGGDHFEFRPLDLYFPFLYLLVFYGALQLARTRRATIAVIAALGLVLAGIVELPLRSHLEFEGIYTSGFPGMGVGKRAAAKAFLDPARGALSRLPGFHSLAERHRDGVRWMTAHFVAIRQEEHEMFLRFAVREAKELLRLVDEGLLPADTHIAVDSVGAIPYYTGFPTLDRLGLTDARVARSDFKLPGVLAHGKKASGRYARERGVDLWAADPVRLLWRLDDPRLQQTLRRIDRLPAEHHIARVGQDRLLLVWLPQGLENARHRFPALRFRSVHEDGAIQEILHP